MLYFSFLFTFNTSLPILFHLMILFPILLRKIEAIRVEFCTLCHQDFHPPIKRHCVHCLFLLLLFIAITGEKHLHLCTDPIFSHLGLLESPSKVSFLFPISAVFTSPWIFPISIKPACPFSLSLFKIIIGPTSVVAIAPLFYVYNKAPQRSCLYWLLFLCFRLAWTHCNQPSTATIPSKLFLSASMVNSEFSSYLIKWKYFTQLITDSYWKYFISFPARNSAFYFFVLVHEMLLLSLFGWFLLSSPNSRLWLRPWAPSHFSLLSVNWKSMLLNTIQKLVIFKFVSIVRAPLWNFRLTYSATSLHFCVSRHFQTVMSKIEIFLFRKMCFFHNLQFPGSGNSILSVS